MGRHTFLSVLAVTLIALAVAMLLPPERAPEPARQLPWQIEPTAEGSIRVFGMTLGRTTLGEAEQIAAETAEVSLFTAADTGPVIEAYFDQVILNGLKAKMVFSLDLSEALVAEMYARGARIATMGSGTRKVTLGSEDLQQVRQAAIRSITYIPQINLEEQMLRSRFGAPERRVREPKSETVHWLYPAKGLDIAYHAEAKEVLQYVQPRDFAALMAPLLEQGERLD